MTRSKNETLPLLLALFITAGLLGAGAWFLRGLVIPGQNQVSLPQPNDGQSSSGEATLPASSEAILSQLDTSQPDPTVLAIDGSVTMVALVKQLQLAYTQINPTLPTTYGIPDGRPNGTNAGINSLTDGRIALAASSRPLTAEERNAGLQSIPIARDALAVVVGVDNPFRGSLTLDQLKQIFQGQITNWSEVGGPNQPIRVINRSPSSGSATLFKDIVLLGQSFAPDGQNFTTLSQDETTPLLRALGKDGISYSTVQQVENQKTVRMISIEGISPADREAIKTNQYPLSRVVYLTVKQPTSPAVKQFIEMTLSPQGQQIVSRVGFIPL